MFYEENQINEVIRCPYCQNKYNDPRLVECSSSFCMSCIELLIKNGENGFKCPICRQFHEIPRNGYLKNSNLAKLCEMKANEVSRGSLADSLKAQLDEIKLKLAVLAKENQLGADKIKEHCDGLRNAVQLSSEQLIETIKAHNLDLIDQINHYENKSILDFNKQNKIQLENFIQNMQGFHSKWTNYLKQFKLKDADLQTASAQANECLEQIKNENEQMLAKLFNDVLIQFNKNPFEIKSKIIGSFSKAASSPDLSLINLNELDLSKSSSINKQEPISVKLLNDGRISVAYRVNDMNDVEIAVFDSKFNRLHQKVCHSGRNFRIFQLSALANNSIVLCLTCPNKCLNFYNNKSDDEYTFQDFTNTLSTIKLFDDKLRKLKSTLLSNYIGYTATSDNKLFCMIVDGSCHFVSIKIYDENLTFLEYIGQACYPNLPFFIPYGSNKVQVCGSYFVFRDMSEVIFLDRASGWVIKRLKVDNYNFLLDPISNSLLTYRNESKQVVRTDLDGKVQTFNVNISKADRVVKLVGCLNDKLVFLDEKSHCLFISKV